MSLSNNSNNRGPDPIRVDDAFVKRKRLTFVVYILFAAFFISGIPLIAGIIVNYIKSSDMDGTLFASHFAWQRKTFWYSLLGWILSVPLIFLLGFGVLFSGAVTIWFIYRVIKGMLNLHDDKPMGTDML